MIDRLFARLSDCEPDDARLARLSQEAAAGRAEPNRELARLIQSHQTWKRKSTPSAIISTRALNAAIEEASMPAPIPTEVSIGDTIRADQVPGLCKAIADECVSLEWGDAYFRPETAEDLLAACQKFDGVRLLWLC
jgi:hypothetical protein